MFGALKNKLKGWMQKSTEETQEETQEITKKETKAPVKTKKSTPKQTEKKVVKQKSKRENSKEEISTHKQEPIIKEPKEEVPKPEKKKFSFFTKALTEEKFEELFCELEIILLTNNVATGAIDKIKEELKKELVGQNKQTEISNALKNAISSLLQEPPSILEQIQKKENAPFVILFAGINGAGKTTTIAKVAKFLQNNNLTVCLTAADTFRAAAIEQLQTHANKLELPIIKKDYGADPASVAFDAIKYAQKYNIEVVLVDTAGRMNNRDSLMKEIEKIANVTKADLKLFVAESTTGNDATTQAKDFNEAIQLDGTILTKADVDEKGGTAISIAHATNKPIYFLGTGQNYENIELFDKEKLLKQLFG